MPTAMEDTTSIVPLPSPPGDYPFLAPPQGPDELGRLGNYLIRKVLGVGAMGVVFEALDAHLKRLVALKVMKPSLAALADYHRRFLREAQLAAAIEHEHIVTIYQVGEDRGVPFLAMRLLQGETLEERLDKSGGWLPPPEVLRIGREIAEGLGAAHARGLVHRDIKPANVWLEAGRDKVKIVDFGLACGTGDDGRFTTAGAVIGTPAYMAPEQANAEEVDGRCDLFSLGSVLYRTCTGELPFGGKDTLSILAALATKTPEPPHKINPAVPRAFSLLVMRLLAKDRDKRPQSAEEVVKSIEAIERGETLEEEAPTDVLEEAPTDVLEEIPPPRVRKAQEVVPSPAAKKVQESGVGSGGTKRKPAKKTRPAVRRKKRPEATTNWSLVVIVASLVLLALAVVVLLLGVIHRASKAHSAASNDPRAIASAQYACLSGSTAMPARGPSMRTANSHSQ
jgi:serine/threonine protein kinase